MKDYKLRDLHAYHTLGCQCYERLKATIQGSISLSHNGWSGGNCGDWINYHEVIISNAARGGALVWMQAMQASNFWKRFEFLLKPCGVFSRYKKNRFVDRFISIVWLGSHSNSRYVLSNNCSENTNAARVSNCSRETMKLIHTPA